jgi:hypothetical protein
MRCRGRVKTEWNLTVCPHTQFCKLYTREKGAKCFSELPVTSNGYCAEFIKKPDLISQAVNLNDVIPRKRKIKSRPSKMYRQGELFNT